MINYIISLLNSVSAGISTNNIVPVQVVLKKAFLLKSLETSKMSPFKKKCKFNSKKIIKTESYL